STGSSETKWRPGRETPTIRSGPQYVAAGNISAERVVRSASFGMSIGGGAHVLQVPGAGQIRIRLRSTASDQARHNSCECNVKALWHLQCGGLNSHSSGQMQAIICCPTN